jgi:hypothetical protein
MAMDPKRVAELAKLNTDSSRNLAKQTGRPFEEPLEPLEPRPAGVTLHAKGGIVPTKIVNKGYMRK